MSLLSNTSAAVENLKILLQCGFCHQPAKKPCTLGGCDHFFCRSCVDNLKDSQCFVCGVPYHIRDIQSNRQLDTAVFLTSKLARLLKTDQDINSGSLLSENPMECPAKDPPLMIPDIDPPSMIPELDPPAISSPLSSINSSPENVAGRTRRAMKINKKKAFVRKSNKRWGIGKTPVVKTASNKVTFVSLATSSSDQESNDSNTESTKISGGDMSNAGNGKKIGDEDLRMVETTHNVTPAKPELNRRHLRRKSQEDRGNLEAGDDCSISTSISTPLTRKTRSRTEVKTGNTPQSRRSEVVKRVCRDSPVSQSRVGQSRLTSSSAGSSPRIWASPMQSSPRTERRNAKGETPLQVAVIKGDIDLVRLLLEEGASPNTKDHARWTPLHEACNHGFVDIAALLLDHGASINTPGFDNDTPLHDAVTNLRLDCVTLLVSRGASVHARNIHGKTPMDMAQSDAMKKALKTRVTETQSTNTVSDVLQVVDDRQVVAMATALSREEKATLQKCVQMLNGRVQTEFTNHVTHIVTAVNQEGQCPRTVKYLQGVVTGKWLVNYDWVLTCVEYGRRVSEEPFEVPGTSTLPNTLAPQLGRLNQQAQLPGLFDGCHFYFTGSFQYPTPPKEDLALLVTLAGGIMLSREPRLSDQSEFTVPYHAKPGSRLENCCYFIVHDNKNKPWEMDGERLCRVDVSFIIDSIAQFRLLDLPEKQAVLVE